MDIEKMYDLYFMVIYSYALSIVGNPSEAEEIAQETFSRALAAEGSYKKGSKELTWLISIARNLCADHFRKEKRRGKLPPDREEIPAPGSFENDIAAKESSLEIHRILHGLREPYREVFELRVFGELAFRDIADIFGKTESWARVTYHRARLKIKERMENHE